MAEEELPNDEQEPVITPMPSITPLATVAIQIHELFSELKNAGFKSKEALTLAGMVLSSTATVELVEDGLLDDGYDPTMDNEKDDEEFGNWDEFLENPEGDEKI